MSQKENRIAVILFNLGGPDKPSSVEPFLYNLFNDPAIISAPWPIRPMLAKLISKRRGPIAREIYDHLGGGSPLVPETQKQCDGLEKGLKEKGYQNTKVFMAMRYWHPFLDETLDQVKNFDPDEILLLPLYPQFSTTTSGSSFKEFYEIFEAKGLGDKKVKSLCCYGEQEAFLKSHVEKLYPLYQQALTEGKVRVLFSAHGLPQKIVDKGDPYENQVRKGVDKIAEIMKNQKEVSDFDYTVCFQSRVGPLKWIGPSLDDEMERAAHDKVNVMVVPIAFVSEHSETLVELDIEYKVEAEKLGIKKYYRVPTLSDDKSYSEALVQCVETMVKNAKPCLTANPIACHSKYKPCPLNKPLFT